MYITHTALSGLLGNDFVSFEQIIFKFKLLIEIDADGTLE